MCRRITDRIRELELDGPGAYGALLERHAPEWSVLDRLCRITISRFGRDWRIMSSLRDDVLPELAATASRREGGRLLVWSAGCASGEEPYTVALLWDVALRDRFPEVGLSILGTDVDDAVLARARAARYPASSVRELPLDWVEQAFVAEGDELRLRDRIARGVTFDVHDVRAPPPGGPFDLVLCRNLAFTYFDVDSQARVAGRLVGAMRPGGALVVGAHEAVPDHPGLEPWENAPCVWRRIQTPVRTP